MIQRPHRHTRRHRVLIVDDDPSVKLVFAEALDADRFELRGALDAGEGLRQVEQWQPDLVVLDQRLPDRAGLEVLPEISGVDRHLPILFLAATQSADTAIRAMKCGAFDYATKPVPLNRLAEQVDRGIENRRLLRSPVVMRETDPDGEPSGAERLVGRCRAMQRIYKSVGRLAAHDLPCLIQGEAGTGKKLTARAIHAHGHRAQRPIRTLRCGDHDPEEILRELFGCDRSGQPGLLAACHGGTLIVEEIAELPAAAQSSLLMHMRRGDDRTRRLAAAGSPPHQPAGTESDITLIFTTTGDIDQLVTSRRVRSDLFYELSGNVLALPPLRERGVDLRLLVNHYVQKLLGIRSVQPDATVRVSDGAVAILSSYHWPGNIAELKSVLRRALIESRGTVLASEYLCEVLGQPRRPETPGRPNAPEAPAPGAPEDASRASCPRGGAATDARAALEPSSNAAVPDDLVAKLQESGYWRAFVSARRDDDEGTLYAIAVERLEEGLLSAMLEATEGNLAQAARRLGMTRVSLRKKIQKLGLVIPGRGKA